MAKKVVKDLPPAPPKPETNDAGAQAVFEVKKADVNVNSTQTHTEIMTQTTEDTGNNPMTPRKDPPKAKV